MLKRKPSAQRQDKNWFMFSSGLMLRVCADYISMRTLHQCEPLTCAPTICVLMLDVVEKSLKLHLAVQTKTDSALSDMQSLHGHNIESLRRACAEFQPLFNDSDVCSFTKDLNDRDGKLYQQLRYGSQQTTIGFSTRLSVLLPVVDKVFIQSLLLLPKDDRRLLVDASPLKSLLVGSNFDQSRHPTQLIELLRRDNAHFSQLLEYCQDLEREHAALVAQLSAAQKQSKT